MAAVRGRPTLPDLSNDIARVLSDGSVLRAHDIAVCLHQEQPNMFALSTLQDRVPATLAKMADTGRVIRLKSKSWRKAACWKLAPADGSAANP